MTSPLLLRKEFNPHSSTLIKAEASVRHFRTTCPRPNIQVCRNSVPSKVTCKLISRAQILKTWKDLSARTICTFIGRKLYLGLICLKPPMNPAIKPAAQRLPTCRNGGRFQARHVNRPQPETAPCLYPVFRQNTPT